ncbi:xanthine dehydrogenase family protein molybdopterin-binding subunit [Pelagicoccus sp. SDUM812002]|uniref:xanthine dehydrogenase family protein molybdopterin-binding subunit n=1 Tax=Pelagicoccus sp. SDUM812002 TaxID=3041266 RepID=UPI00280C6820|nr:xanthine dehydrogenase family protein molybdopterin-binding subunit [Pelagicoccus sp. SDUM812002]MDQ8188423.1 xanthine dehydrogenase family protein molybdopterin-binding subunit [Pelagicoccus sp. SDUM812002]
MDTNVIGKSLNRIDGRQKVTGGAQYAADIQVADKAYAYGIRSETAAGELLAVDATETEALPGVLAVLHALDAPKFFRCPDDLTVGERRPPFEDNQIYYAGQLVALVVAETFEQARRGAQLLKLKYREDSDVSLDFVASLKGGSPKETDSKSRGEPEGAFSAAKHRVDETYFTSVGVHCAMEMHGATAWWEEGRLVVEDSTQWVVGQRKALAKTFGIPESDVEVRSRFVGGGFGGKLFIWPTSILAAEAARVVGRPVQFSLDRRGQFTTAGHRPSTMQRIRLAADEEGHFLSLRHDSVNQTSYVDEYDESASDVSGSLYECPNVATSQGLIKMRTGTPTPMRGPGETPGLWALESAIDELAVEMGVDPLELRVRNIAERDGAKDLPWSANLHERCLREAAARFGWAERDPHVGSMREGDEVIGWGIASTSWAAMRSEASVNVEFHSDGTARVSCATQDIGTGTYTVFAQVVSELTGLPVERIDVRIGNSSYATGPISGGSMVTASVVPAIADATEKGLEALFELATSEDGPFAGRERAELQVCKGNVALVGSSEKAFGIGEVLKRGRLAYVRGEGKAAPGDEQDEYSFRSFGAHCVEVRWDPGVGRLRVSRVTSVIDSGRIINLKTASNQVYGAIMMGVGMALLEESVYDKRTGRPVSDNLADYLIPVMTDTPEVDLNLLDEPDPHLGKMGARGIGEIGLTGVAPAIGNAVYHATGKRIRKLPIRIEDLL